MKYHTKDECYYCKRVTTFIIYTDTSRPYASCTRCSRLRHDHIQALLRNAEPCQPRTEMDYEVEDIPIL